MMTIHRMASLWCCIGMGLVGVFLAEAAYAVNIPPIPEMSSEAAALHPELVQRCAALRHERDQLHDRTINHNSKCGSVEEGSAAETSCASQLDALSAAVDRHIQASTQFIEDYKAAEAERIRDAGLRGLRTGTTVTPNTDPMVVDARNVPSGLPKRLDNAIASAYASAPTGVSDRVRKGFQAVMERDWAVAKAWFQDALNHDPNNAGLKRLVALTDTPQQLNNQQHKTVDERNEPAGLGGKSDAKWAGAPASKFEPAPATTIDPNMQLPDLNDIRFLFPGLQAMKDRETPVFKTLPDGSRVQLPQESDLEFLFGPPSQPPASKSGKTK